MFSTGLLYSFSFQYPKREVYFFSTFFHDFVIIGLVFIIRFVGVIFFLSLRVTSNVKSNNSLEIYLMLVPILFLFFLSIPSMLLLRSTGKEYGNFMYDVYVDASQWFWEYRGRFFTQYVSSLCKTCASRTWHNLEPKLPLVLPTGYNNFFFFRNDVLHSFALPSMGIKVDCVPGLLTSLDVNILTPGVFYGQCSELCGVNHSFMPIEVEVHVLKNNAI